MSDEQHQDNDSQSPGQIVDNLGMKIRLNEGDFVTDAIVIFKIVGDDGRSRVAPLTSVGLDWITKRGMLEVVRDVERVDSRNVSD